MPTIKRGEIYKVDWNPGRGSEQIGERPALVIQNNIGNEYSSTTIVAACSTANVKSYPFVVSYKAKECGMSTGGHVNLAQILTIDKKRLIAKCGELSPNKMKEVDDAIKNSLGLDEILNDW